MFAADPDESGRTRVKICGITNVADAEAAIDAGADAIGLNCYRGSKRFLNIDEALSWLEELPPVVAKVIVAVDPSYEDALRLAQLSFVTGLQLHGCETPKFCGLLAKAGVPFAKALPVRDEGSLADALSFGTGTLVLDTFAETAFGGTGTTFPWSIARTFRQAHPRIRVILAGGLTPENVSEAVREVRPFAVDVTTGVESAPGRKDHLRMRDFIAAVREA